MEHTHLPRLSVLVPYVLPDPPRPGVFASLGGAVWKPFSPHKALAPKGADLHQCLQRQKLFEDFIDTWCLRNAYLSESGGLPVPVLDDKRPTSMPNTLHATNFRSLCYVKPLKQFTAALRDVEGDMAFTKLLNLHVDLMTTFDVGFLDYYVNRLYQGLHAVSAPDREVAWEEVHRRYPFLWVLYAVHKAMHAVTVYRPPE